MDAKVLEEIGFTKNEIKIYITLLELEESTTGPLIRKSRVSRSKVYDLLEKLKDKGLVSQSKKGKINYFKALSPRMILEYIEEKEKGLNTKKENFKKDLLPLLLKREESKTVKQEVKMYVGFKGMKTFFNELKRELNDSDEYLGISFDTENINKSINYMFHNFHKERAKRNAKSKIIFYSKEKKKPKKINDKNYEFRYSTQKLPPGMSIYNNTVATFNWKNTPKIFVIVSEENANMYKDFFNDLWEKSK